MAATEERENILKKSNFPILVELFNSSLKAAADLMLASELLGRYKAIRLLC